MKKVKLLLIVAVVFIFCGIGLGADIQTYQYTEYTGDTIKKSVTNVSVTDEGYIIHWQNDDQDQYYIHCDENYATIKWQYINEVKGTTLDLIREGNLIKVSGKDKSQNVNKKIKINDLIWFQFVEVSFSKFLRSNDESVEFWLIQPENLKPYKMIAYKKGIETVFIDGKSITCQKVKVSLTGLLSVFWSVEYWFRDSDKLFVRYEGTRGFGAPKTIVELIH